MTPNNVRTESKDQQKSTEYSLTVSRALGILSMFSPARTELSLADISREAKLSKPSILRFMQSMVMHGYVEQDEFSKKYRPGIETFRIGTLVGERGIRTVAMPLLRALTDETGFSSYLSVLRQDKIIVMASVEGKGPLRFSAPIGEMMSVHNTSAGQAALSTMNNGAVTKLLKNTKVTRSTKTAPASVTQLLERLDEVRQKGYALSWEMSAQGVGSVASTVMDANGRLAGVITLGFGTGQVDRTDCARLGKRVSAAAKELSTSILKSGGMTEPEI